MRISVEPSILRYLGEACRWTARRAAFDPAIERGRQHKLVVRRDRFSSTPCAQGYAVPTNSPKRVPGAGAHTASREVQTEGTVHRALFHHLSPEMLRTAFFALRREAAPGVDGLTWRAYAADLDHRIEDLHARVRYHVRNLWRRTLRRRSQKDRTTWARVTKLGDDWLPRPRILVVSQDVV